MQVSTPDFLRDDPEDPDDLDVADDLDEPEDLDDTDDTDGAVGVFACGSVVFAYKLPIASPSVFLQSPEDKTSSPSVRYNSAL